MISAGEHQSGAVREIADGNERGIAVTNDVQTTVHRCQLHQRGAAAPFLLPNIGTGEDLKIALGGTRTPCRRGAIRLPQQIEYFTELQRWRPAPTQPARPPANRPPERRRDTARRGDNAPHGASPRADGDGGESQHLQPERDPASSRRALMND